VRKASRNLPDEPGKVFSSSGTAAAQRPKLRRQWAARILSCRHANLSQPLNGALLSCAGVMEDVALPTEAGRSLPRASSVRLNAGPALPLHQVRSIETRTGYGRYRGAVSYATLPHGLLFDCLHAGANVPLLFVEFPAAVC